MRGVLGKPERKPNRKAVAVSVLDYPHVGQEHGGSTSGCFTDALLMSRMLNKFYGFTPKETVRTPSEPARGASASTSASPSRQGEAKAADGSIDIVVCDEKVKDQREGRGRPKAMSPMIQVCCTYTWDCAEEEEENAKDAPSSKALLSPSSSNVRDTGLAGTSEADCEVVHASDTHREVVRALKWLVKDVRKGDTLVFHFSGCSTYKRVSTGEGLEPVLCLGDFSWRDNDRGFLDCETLHEILTKGLQNVSCELTIILDTYLGSALAELLEERSKAIDRTAFENTSRVKYRALPTNRARALPLPAEEKKVLKRLLGKQKGKAGWRRLLDKFIRLTTGFRGEGEGGSNWRKSTKISPSPAPSPMANSSQESSPNRRFKPPRRATGMVPLKLGKADPNSKVVILSAEATNVGGRVEKINRINMVKLGPLTWVLYRLLKGGLAVEHEQETSLSDLIDKLHPTLGQLAESADEHFEHRWRAGSKSGRKLRGRDGGARSPPYKAVARGWGFGEKNGEKEGEFKGFRLFGNVHSEQLLLDRAGLGQHPLETMRTLSLTHNLADVIETPTKREMAKLSNNLNLTPSPARKKELAPLKIPRTPIIEEEEQEQQEEREQRLPESNGAVPKATGTVSAMRLPHLDKKKADRKVRERKVTSFSPMKSNLNKPGPLLQASTIEE
ncbi:hypothetical protein HOP50_05g39520 [Chloropicon primus]|uniref:Uncharacterized protein n=1 Tax=Chloropicon primus TaxID=1764295 RepID=A0A5B8MP99_9CHLO|nr:hypothetical protein A3770_05p39430 [Chloropicon primus]UPR00637.1 hypothetical protein HOP50_05g39520 [Chloropicon primus]|eukprot:QDZ21425.1 hypothetical protein A3770_05p39430 [Chloropicon primus]